MENKVWFMQTIVGVNLVAVIDWSKSTDQEYALLNPLQHALLPHPGQPGALKESYGEAAQFAKDSKDTVMIYKSHVFLRYEPEQRIVTNYEKAIADIRMKKSGLVMPNTHAPSQGLQL